MSEMVIRPAVEDDAKAFLSLWDALDTETEFMLFEPGERQATLESQQTRLANAASSDNVQILVVDIPSENKIAGFCAGRRNSNMRDRHAIEIVIGIREQYVGKQWGYKLLTELEKWAKEIDAKRLALGVMTNNTRAIALYKKLGYEIEGTKRNSVCLRSGYVDEYIMAKLI